MTDGRAPFFVTGGLGSGGYGVVVEVKHHSSDKTFALKKIPKKTLIRSKDRRRLATELEVMMDLPPCPFLLRCYSAFETSEDIFFVLDLFRGGNLFFHLAQHIMAASTPKISRAREEGYSVRAIERHRNQRRLRPIGLFLKYLF